MSSDPGPYGGESRPQAQEWRRFLERWNDTHDTQLGQSVGLAYYLMPCPTCKAPHAEYCHFKGQRALDKVCPTRVRLWELSGMPGGYGEREPDLLVLRMLEAAEDG